MKCIYLLLAICGFSFLAAGIAHGQDYLEPKWDDCISKENPASGASALGSGVKLLNKCSIALSVQGIPRNGSSPLWQINIGPDSWQIGAWDMEGYQLYVCPSGYYAVDEDGSTFQTAIEEYQCKQL